MQDLLNAIKQIPFYQDENFKRGNRNALRGMETVHFVLYPFLNALGYPVYSPETVKMQDIVVNGRIDVSLYIQHKRVMGFLVKDYVTHQTLESLENAYQKQAIGKDTKEVPITVITNGVHFIYYTGEHQLLALDLLEIDTSNAQFLYKIASNVEQIANLSNPRFLTELRLESSFGNLKQTEFLHTALMELLKSPDAGFLDMLSRKIHDAACMNLPISTLENALASELSTSPTMLFDMVQVSEPMTEPVHHAQEPVGTPHDIIEPSFPPTPPAPIQPILTPNSTMPPTPEVDEPKSIVSPSDTTKTELTDSRYRDLISADDDDGEGESLENLL